jgi:hypothetical protein
MLDISGIKKAELHCHIDGLIDAKMLETLKINNINIEISTDQLDAVCPVSSLQDWSENYGKLIYPYVHNRADILLKALRQHLINLRDQHVIYTEIMLSSINTQCRSLEEQMQLYRQFCEISRMTDDQPVQV